MLYLYNNGVWYYENKKGEKRQVSEWFAKKVFEAWHDRRKQVIVARSKTNKFTRYRTK